MSTKDNEINRDIDTAEGHIRRLVVEEAEDAGKRTSSIQHEDGLDDEAEGHVVRFVGDAEDPGIVRL
jgi:hypothetical protein